MGKIIDFLFGRKPPKEPERPEGRLSVAIRAGVTKRPYRARGGYFGLVAYADNFYYGSSSIGAAFEGAGLISGVPATPKDGPLKYAVSDSLPTVFPELRQPVDPCSECGRDMDSLWTLLNHLNDAHNWTRERVAQWLDRKGL